MSTSKSAKGISRAEVQRLLKAEISPDDAMVAILRVHKEILVEDFEKMIQEYQKELDEIDELKDIANLFPITEVANAVSKLNGTALREGTPAEIYEDVMDEMNMHKRHRFNPNLYAEKIERESKISAKKAILEKALEEIKNFKIE